MEYLLWSFTRHRQGKIARNPRVEDDRRKSVSDYDDQARIDEEDGGNEGRLDLHGFKTNNVSLVQATEARLDILGAIVRYFQSRY